MGRSVREVAEVAERMVYVENFMAARVAASRAMLSVSRLGIMKVVLWC